MNRKVKLYFQPCKSCARAIELEEAELQQKRDTEDKRLQAAIMRDEKAREAAEKKAKRETERAAAREEIARDKTARIAENEIKKAQNGRNKIAQS